jgi:hypothetical protein
MTKSINLYHSRKRLWILAAALFLALFAFPGLLAAARPPADSTPEGLHLLHSSEAGVEIELIGPDYTVRGQQQNGRDCQEIALPGYDLTEIAGQPALPVRVFLLGAPPNADFSLQVASRQTQQIPDISNVCQFSGDDQIADVHATNPSEEGNLQQLVRVQDMGFMRSQRLLRLEIYPVQTNPLTGETLYHQQIHINLQFEGDISGGVVQEPAAFETMFSANILNYETAKAWRAAQTEPPQLGAWTPPQPAYKIPITEAGLVALTKADLRTAGLPVDALNPRTLKMYFMGQELAILVTGEQDGSLDDSDVVLFYGEGVNTRYTDAGVYWLSYGGALGKRMAAQPSLAGGSLAATHTSLVHSEDNKFYVSSLPKESGYDHWYGLRIDALPPNAGHQDYTLALSHVASGDYQAMIEVAVAGNFDGVHHLRLYVNGSQVHDDTWTGRTVYQGGAQFPQNLLHEGDNTVRIELANDTAGQPIDMAYMDWLQLTYQRTYQVDDDWLLFGGDVAGSHRYQLDGFTSSDIELFDVTDFNQVRQITGATVSDLGGGVYRLQFGANESGQSRYLALTTAQRRSPLEIIPDTPSNLQSHSNSADYIVVSHHDFLTAVQPLVTTRVAQGKRVALVDVQDIYDEFGYGLMSAEAIHDFLSYAYHHWQSPAPVDILLVGDGTYDMRHYLGTSMPTYLPPFLEMVDFDLGETAADNRFVTVQGDDILPDMNVGRLPANTTAEAQVMVDKILQYETLTPEDAWTKNVLFVADNLGGGGGNFYELSDSIADGYADPPSNTIKLLPEEYARTKVYQGQSCLTQDPSVACRQELLDTIDAGTLMVSFIGHGSKTFWASEHLYDIDAIQGLTNGAKMPIMLPMTCNEGYFHEPKVGAESTSEAGLRYANGGAVASWAPTGFGLSTGHDFLERGLFLSVFHDGADRLGTSTTAGKLYLIANAPSAKYLDLIDTFLLLGDPALLLPVSGQELERTLFLPLAAKELRK